MAFFLVKSLEHSMPQGGAHTVQEGVKMLRSTTAQPLAYYQQHQHLPPCPTSSLRPAPPRPSTRPTLTRRLCVRCTAVTAVSAPYRYVMGGLQLPFIFFMLPSNLASAASPVSAADA